MVSITATSSLVLDGSSVIIKSLQLDGALIITAVDGAEVIVDGAVVKNDGWTLTSVAFDDVSVEEKYRIRGYIPSERNSEQVYNVTVPGKYVIDAEGLRSVA